MGEWRWSDNVAIQHRIESGFAVPGAISLAPSEEVKCRLRWTERPADYASALWQVFAVEPSPKDMSDSPYGLIASGPVELQSGTDEFEISFDPMKFGAGRLKRPKPTQPPPARTYHVRVVSLDHDRQPFSSATNTSSVTVEFSFTGVSEAALEKIRDEQQRLALLGDVKIRRLAYRPVRLEHWEAFRHFVVTRDLTLLTTKYKRGDKLYFPPPDPNEAGFSVGDVFDAVDDAVGGLAEFVEDTVNWASIAMADIKAAMVDVVANDILDCGAPCEIALGAALDAGLAAMGVPPSIPNFDQLAQMGKGYLVETLAETAAKQTGVPVPPEVIERGVDALYEQAKKVGDHGPGGDQWLRLDPDFQYRPPIAEIEVENTNAESSPPMTMSVSHPLYLSKELSFPPIPPHSRLMVPVVMDPWDLQAAEWGVQKRVRDRGGVWLVGENRFSYWWEQHNDVETTLGVRLSPFGQFAQHTFVAAAGCDVVIAST